MEKGFTKQAEQVLNNAKDIAKKMRHPYVGTEHLLCALRREFTGVAGQVLSMNQVEEEDIIQVIEELISPFIKDEPDTLILGCTHFPIFKKIISDLLPNTAIVSCSDEGARALAQRCTDTGEGRLNFLF